MSPQGGGRAGAGRAHGAEGAWLQGEAAPGLRSLDAREGCGVRPGRPVDLLPGLGSALFLHMRLRGRTARGERGMPPAPRQETRPRLLSGLCGFRSPQLPSEPCALRGHQGGRGSRCPRHHPVHTRHAQHQEARLPCRRPDLGRKPFQKGTGKPKTQHDSSALTQTTGQQARVSNRTSEGQRGPLPGNECRGSFHRGAAQPESPRTWANSASLSKDSSVSTSSASAA